MNGCCKLVLISAVALLVCSVAMASEPVPIYCLWCPQPFCCAACGTEKQCTVGCGGCISVPDPVFVDADQRDTAGLMMARRQLATDQYHARIRKLVDEMATW